MMWWFFLTITFLILIFVVLYIASDRGAPPVKLLHSHVIITGGSSGIGLATAKLLAKKGANITILARDVEKLKDAQIAIEKERHNQNQQVNVYSVDVCDFEAVNKAIIQSARCNNDRIDVLITSAGISRPERFSETKISNMSWIMHTNYLGALYCTRSVAPYMKKQNSGRIIYVSSILGLLGFTGYASYSASKFALRGLAESLQTEFAPWHIYFSLSCPGNVSTPMFVAEEKIKPPETKKLEAGKVVSPDVVANSIIQSLSSWRFTITSDTDGWLVSTVTGGFSPASFVELVEQFFLGSIVRIVSQFELKKFKQVVSEHVLKEKKE